MKQATSNKDPMPEKLIQGEVGSLTIEADQINTLNICTNKISGTNGFPDKCSTCLKKE